MASMKLIVAFLALVAVALVESKPLLTAVASAQVGACPDEFIRLYFDEVKVTVFSDFDWIQTQMKACACKKEVAEYAALVKALSQLEAAKRTFEDDYTVIQTEVYQRVSGFQSKYNLLSICYTERIVSVRKTVKQRLHPDLRNFRAAYIRMLPLFNNFYTKHNIPRLVRARVQPRGSDYNAGLYFPPSSYTDDVKLLISTTHKDYQYLRDLINRYDCKQGTPEYELKMKLLDNLVDTWADFNVNRRELECDYYPRFIDVGDDRNAIDAIYKDYIEKLRGHTYKFAYMFFDEYSQIEDLYLKNKLPFQAYMDFDVIGASKDVRGLYLPSNKLSKYYTNLVVTTRVDYLTAQRLWKNLDLAPNTPECELRDKMLRDLKEHLDNLEILINRNIRDTFKRTYEYYQKNPNCVFDTEYDSIIVEITNAADKDILPMLYEFKDSYFVNDNTLADLFKKRNIDDATRNIMACDVHGYDITIMIPDDELRELFRWSENLMKENYYGAVQDLVQLQFDDGCEEWKMRRDSLKRLENVWLEYRKITNYAIRKYTGMMRKGKYVIGTPEYVREIKKIREYCRPKMVVIVDKFKKDCFDINGYLDKLYAKKTCNGCVRGYSYAETSFEITVKSTVTVTKSC